MRRKLTATALALLAALSTAAFAGGSPDDTTTEACQVCRRTQCQQICGPQKPAFCDIDPVTGCPFCACNG